MKRALPSLLLGLIGLLFVAGWAARQQIDVEFSLAGLEALRVWVAGFGWLGPAVFVGLVAFRNFLLLPSALMLVLGGIAFGAVAGTVLGGLGLIVSASLQFGAARVFGDEWVRPRLGEHGRAMEEHLNRAGPWVVALATGHPAGPMTPVHIAAGLSSMHALGFGLAVLLAGPVRAGTYSFMGSSIVEWGFVRSLTVAAVLGALALLPLLHPRVRSWIFGPLVDARGMFGPSSGGSP